MDASQWSDKFWHLRLLGLTYMGIRAGWACGGEGRLVQPLAVKQPASGPTLTKQPTTRGNEAVTKLGQ
eukprot:8080374-Lingulodinium_polyedra.AAC.1